MNKLFIQNTRQCGGKYDKFLPDSIIRLLNDTSVCEEVQYPSKATAIFMIVVPNLTLLSITSGKADKNELKDVEFFRSLTRTVKLFPS